MGREGGRDGRVVGEAGVNGEGAPSSHQIKMSDPVKDAGVASALKHSDMKMNQNL